MRFLGQLRGYIVLRKTSQCGVISTGILAVLLHKKETILLCTLHQPLKMDLTEGFETSAKLNLTPWENPKENTQDSEHGETLKSRKQYCICIK
jgi:hypothetical protein